MDPIDLALLVLRVVFGLFLAAHGYNKVFGGGGLAGTAAGSARIGMRWPRVQARLAAGTEIGAGVLFAARPADAVRRRRDDRRDGRRHLVAHRNNGFFIFKDRAGSTPCRSPSPPGPSPRSAPASASLDHAIGLDWTAWDGWIGAVIAGVVGLGGGLAQLAICYRPPPKAAST